MKMINAPILHVNGDHPEAVCSAAKLAIDYRWDSRMSIVLKHRTYIAMIRTADVESEFAKWNPTNTALIATRIM